MAITSPSARSIDVDGPFERPSDKPFDKAKEHHFVRKWISYGLIGIFGGEMLFACISFIYQYNVEGIKSVMIEILGPTMALVGYIIGFYFSSSDKE